MMLQAQHLFKVFKEDIILQNVNLTVSEGEILAVRGSSGSGKSTLLALLGLILSPSAGSVVVEGKDCSLLSDEKRAALRRTRFGFVFQHTQLVSSLRALDNVLLPVNLLTAPERDQLERRLGAWKHRAQELLTFLGLADRLSHYPHQLSVGQKRRVALARALICDAPLILADEPTNDLDNTSAQKVAELLLKAARQRNKAVVIATHDSALSSLADSSFVVEDALSC